MSRRVGPRPDVILIASGSELSLAVAAADRLRAGGAIRVRVVSMPCWRLFEEQDRGLPGHRASAGGQGAGRGRGGGRRSAGIASSADAGAVVGIDRFGASAPGDVVMRELGFTVAHVVESARALVGAGRR